MSWNEPGGDDKDPWSSKDQKGPPDLDEALRSLQEKLGQMFGGGSSGDNSSGGQSGNDAVNNWGFLAVGVVALIWLASLSIYSVDAGYQGVVTFFGKYDRTTSSGLNYLIPFIEHVDKINVKDQRYIEVGYRSGEAGLAGGAESVPKEALMLTKDENYVDVRLAVQYQVKNAKEFNFNLVDPKDTLKQVTESAMRGVVGSNTMDFVLTEGRTEIVAQIKKEIQDVMDDYQSGIQIVNVNLQDAQAPEQVQKAFEDVIKAREDEQRKINEAQAYANDVVPKARGAAARKIQEAEGYKEQVIAQAEGETTRFSKLLAQYTKAPEVTRKRMYIESMESALSSTNTVLVDSKAGNNMIYLPLDKMLQHSSTNPTAQDSDAQEPKPQVQAATVQEPSVEQDTSRSRERDSRGR